MIQNLQKEIRELISSIIEIAPEEIAPEKHLVQDLGADSMSALEIMASLEQKYGIVIHPEHLPQLATLNQACGLVTSLLHAE